jgi:Meiotically up-regulated gene 113
LTDGDRFDMAVRQIVGKPLPGAGSASEGVARQERSFPIGKPMANRRYNERMAATLKDVYCYQRGTEDCYKIGRTKVTPEKRKQGFSTGSSLKLTLRRTEKTAHPTKLEKYIHMLLSAKRAENGEFFFITKQEADAAFDAAVAFVSEAQELIENAAKVRKRKPTGAMLYPTPELVDLYRKLKARERDCFLIEQEILVLQSRMQIVIGENTGIDGLATWKWRDTVTLDLKKLQREEPDTYKALRLRYERTTGTRYFEPADGILTKASD